MPVVLRHICTNNSAELFFSLQDKVSILLQESLANECLFRMLWNQDQASKQTQANSQANPRQRFGTGFIWKVMLVSPGKQCGKWQRREGRQYSMHWQAAYCCRQLELGATGNLKTGPQRGERTGVFILQLPFAIGEQPLPKLSPNTSGLPQADTCLIGFTVKQI